MALSTAEPLSDNRRLHLLVADDDPLLRSIAATKFAGISSSLRTVCDGREALDAMNVALPDLLLLDIDMPNVDGFEVLKTMRGDPATKNIPVIVVTGRGDSAAIEHAFAEGASSFVVKPIHWDLLIHQINFVWRAAENAESLKRAVAAADQASHAKSRFLASASHELRTPLNAIIGFSELLNHLPEFGQTGRAREYLDDIRGSGHRLLNLINRILDIAKLDIGVLTLRRSPLNLLDVLQEVQSEVVAPTERDVTVQFSAASPLKLVDGDSNRLKQVINNLLDNAVKFSKQGGTVTVTACNEAEDVIITIADQGIGMDADQIDRALETFTQIDDRLERRYDGLGIGLSIAHRLVRLHGGQLEMRSEPDCGTEVTIRLPAIRA